MNHRIAGRKLGRTTDHKEAMLKNMVTSLIIHERIETTEARAKELRRMADRMITLGKRGNLASIRRAGKTVKTREALGKLFDELAPKFEGRNGGYTRIIHSRTRKGDGAPMVIMEWVESIGAATAEPSS
ncbi:MAG: 50S ribosomal protein L17 [Thermodesulfobacteriota bacterium]|nr:50S ribosomal protein L17 [Thermodesulfobacteriota bacterium]